jgi:hypothetical protein
MVSADFPCHTNAYKEKGEKFFEHISYIKYEYLKAN